MKFNNIKENFSITQDEVGCQLWGEYSGFIEKMSLGQSAILIQKAIDLLGNLGGEIKIGRGVFPIQETINLSNKVTILGSGNGTVLKASFKPIIKDEEIIDKKYQSLIFADEKDHIRIHNLNLEGDEYCKAGIIIDHCGRVDINNVNANQFIEYGIWVRNQSFLCTVTSCAAAGNTLANFYLENLRKGRGGDYNPNLVSNCTSYGGGIGFKVYRTLVLNLVGCVVYQAKGNSFHIEQMSNSVLLSGCRTFQGGAHAVYVNNSNEINLTGNIFCWHRGSGLVLDNVLWGAISGNEFIDNGVRSDPPVSGVVIQNGTKLIQLSSNIIFNWPEQQAMKMGIEISEDSSENNINNNTINYYLNKDITPGSEQNHLKDNLAHKEAFVPRFEGLDKEHTYHGQKLEAQHTWESTGPYKAEHFNKSMTINKNKKNIENFIETI